MAASGVGLRALAGSNGKESKEAESICTPIAMVQQSWNTTPTQSIADIDRVDVSRRRPIIDTITLQRAGKVDKVMLP